MQCSKLFDSVFDSSCGGTVRTCECGITHFDVYNVHDYGYEKDELEELEQKAEKDPGHYIAHDHSVGTMEIDGIEIVCGCTCDLAQKYENFIITHKTQLAEYLNRLAVMLKQKAVSIKVEL